MFKHGDIPITVGVSYRPCFMVLYCVTRSIFPKLKTYRLHGTCTIGRLAYIRMCWSIVTSIDLELWAHEIDRVLWFWHALVTLCDHISLPVQSSLILRPSHRPGQFLIAWSILQAIKHWTVGRPGNEATYNLHAPFFAVSNSSSSVWYFPVWEGLNTRLYLIGPSFQ